MKENNSLLIMVGGASSRMKSSLKNSSLRPEIKKQAEAVHKSLIPLGSNQRPLLYYLISNAESAGYKNIYLITSPENSAFHSQIDKWGRE
jgi:dTDP-glucose pyrophosphorylase